MTQNVCINAVLVNMLIMRDIVTGAILVASDAMVQPSKIASYVDKTITSLIMCAIVTNVLTQHTWPSLKKEYANDANSDAHYVTPLNFVNSASLGTTYIKGGATKLVLETS